MEHGVPRNFLKARLAHCAQVVKRFCEAVDSRLDSGFVRPGLAQILSRRPWRLSIAQNGRKRWDEASRLTLQYLAETVRGDIHCRA